MQKIFELKCEVVNISEIARIEKILHRVHELSEINPMLGHRGVRMGISFPEIYETQIRSICEAAGRADGRECGSGATNNGASDRLGRGACSSKADL